MRPGLATIPIDLYTQGWNIWISALETLSRIAEVTCDIIKELRASPSKRFGCAGKLGPFAYSLADVNIPPSVPEPLQIQDIAPSGSLMYCTPGPLYLQASQHTPMLSSDLFEAPAPQASYLKPTSSLF